MELPPQHVQELLNLVQRFYPGWDDFRHPSFEKDEITYKRDAVAKARELLGRDELRSLLDAGRADEVRDRLRKVGHATNLLYLGTPSTGDLALLHAEPLSAADLGEAVFDLLHGDGPSPQRLDRFANWANAHDLPNKWTFPSIFLFLLHPETDLLVKPSVIRWWLGRLGVKERYTARPNGELYGEILDLAGDLRRQLADFGAQDMVDVQSILWVACKSDEERGKLLPSKQKRRELEELFPEFVRDYYEQPVGLEHRALYGRGRKAAQRSYESILEDREKGEDVTDRVLLELLPYVDSESSRERGAWICVAPAITGNLRGWFEAAGWRQPEDWDDVAAAVLDFLHRCVENPADLEAACSDFSKSPWSTGLQSGMLSPALNALRPDTFVLVNNKSRQVFNYLAGTRLSAKLTDYPTLNRLGLDLVDDLADLLEAAPGSAAQTGDVLDAYCHWLIAVRKFPIGKPRYFKIAPGEGARLWDDWRQGGYAAIGWNELGDLSDVSREDFEHRREEVLEKYPDWTANSLEQVWRLSQLREGDKVVANQGIQRVLAIGTVAGPYYFVDHGEHGHRVPVDWDDTRERLVSEGGWRRTLIELDREHFQQIDAAPSPVDDTEDGGLGARAFELFSGLRRDPTRAFYQEHQGDFQSRVETPFQELFFDVVANLPSPITERMETERNLFSRVPKNDYGRGGAWPFYWGALYPRGGQRIREAQLFLWMTHDRLEAGFYIGEYDTERRALFARHATRLKDQLPVLLQDGLTHHPLVFGAREHHEDPETGDFHDSGDLTWSQWLADPLAKGIQVTRVWLRDEVVATDLDALAGSVAEVFQDLFPLVLLATAEEPLPELESYLVSSPAESDVNPPYPRAELASDLRLGVDVAYAWVRAVERKKQAIFFGPPGTGKTYAALHLARHLVAESDGFVDVVQFHPSYAYEDFIQGIRPEVRADGSLDYPLRRGRFLTFCDRARERTGTCVLVIDEINRANLSRVFGELMYLLEYRDEAVPLAAGGRPFSIPRNVRLLGTMNTADRSIALVDHALRRRFAFLPLRPDYELLQRFHEKSDFAAAPLVEILRGLNREIGDPHYEVGVTFFLHEDLDEGRLEDIWRQEIEPYLEEHFFDQSGKVDAYRWESVARRLKA